MNSLTAHQFIENLSVSTPLDPQEKARLENPYRWAYGAFDLELGDGFSGDFAVTENNLWQVFYLTDGVLEHSVCLAPSGVEGFEVLKHEYSKNLSGLKSREFVFAISLHALRHAANCLSEKNATASLGQKILLPFSISKKYVVASTHNTQLVTEVVVAFNPTDAVKIFKKIHPQAVVLSCGNASDIHHSMEALNSILTHRDLLAVDADYDRVDEKPQQWLYRLQNPSFNENYMRTREEDHNEKTTGYL